MRLLGKCLGRSVVYVDSIPLVGHIAFGVIDRGTNILQVRPTTICPLNCIFCSVDAGPFSRHRATEYVVDRKHLVKWVKHVVDAKGGDVVEALIDGVGEPPTYPEIVELVRDLKSIVPRVAMETHGATLSVKLIDALNEVGLDRLNVSIDTLNPEKAKFLQGVEWFDIRRVISLVEYIVKETSIDVHLTPVWIPGVNDEDIEEIIDWGLRIGVGKRFPPFGIQKYEVHKYGRKVPGVKEPSWSEFWNFLDRLERKYGVALSYKKLIDAFGFRKARRYEPRFKVGEEIVVEIVGPGWLKGEVLAVDREWSVVVTVVGVDPSRVLRKKFLRVKIIRNKDCIFVARPSRA